MNRGLSVNTEFQGLSDGVSHFAIKSTY